MFKHFCRKNKETFLIHKLIVKRMSLKEVLQQGLLVQEFHQLKIKLLHLQFHNPLLKIHSKLLINNKYLNRLNLTIKIFKPKLNLNYLIKSKNLIYKLNLKNRILKYRNKYQNNKFLLQINLNKWLLLNSQIIKLKNLEYNNKRFNSKIKTLTYK